MARTPVRSAALALGFLMLPLAARAEVFDIRNYGAKGDGKTLDTPAINRAIEAAVASGGGTVQFPAGTYLSFSIHLQSNITLDLAPGCVLVAASPATDGGSYDPPEANEWGDKQYQDYGHSHWHDSLIWGENLENVAIIDFGRIHGKGLVRGGGRRGVPPQGPNGTFAPTAANAAPIAANAAATTPGGPATTGVDNAGVAPDPNALPPAARAGFFGGPGSGNKTIALKNCRNVTLRDFSVLQGGWFALLATGVDNLTIDNLRVDTNRDGFDIDACRNVRVTNCHVNAINDDAIVLKSSYALGELRACENIAITGCEVSGFDVGSVLDGTFKRTQERATDRDGPTGRIKFGTESNGGFKNIVIANCVFVRSRGLALETVDGGTIEDVSISNLTMRDVSSSPIFIRLGNRARGPEGTPVGAIRRVSISHIVASNCDPRYPILIAGLPGHPVEDVRLHDIRVTYRGGITLEQVAKQPAEMVNLFFLRGPGLAGPREPFNPPENEAGYPEPSMFGLLPAYGLFVRHASELRCENFDLRYDQPDQRAPVVLMDVAGIAFSGLKVQRIEGSPVVVLRGVNEFSSHASPSLPDTQRAHTDDASL